MAGKMRQGLGCGFDVIGCGTGIVVRDDRSLSHSILRGRLGSGYISYSRKRLTASVEENNVTLHKDAIENSLGVKLIWNRGDDIKSSKISYQINDVSIENETDWLQMAKFHAYWSKKFYDVIVPYLR